MSQLTFDREVYYIWGKSGVGKSTLAEDLVVTNVFEDVHHVGCYWIGVVDGTGIAMYDNFMDDGIIPVEEFVNFVTGEGYLQTQDNHIQNNYSRIIITSWRSPEEIYDGLLVRDERYRNRLRHMKVIHLTEFDQK